MSGLHGRLGDLGTIAAEYDIAISTAAVGPLNYIVVNHTEDAEAVINYLRENNLGRANLLILDKQKQMKSNF